MAIFRVHKTKNFTTINNYLIRDDNLKLKDKGMLLVLLSLPENWDFSVAGLEVICKEARNTINSILNNLEEYGYLERKKIYHNGKIKEWRYDIYEIPKHLYRKNEDIENQYIENEDIKNDTQLNTNKLNKEELIKDKLNITTTTIDNESLYDYLQKNGFVLAPIHYEVVANWKDNELTRHAIKQAVLNNKFNINYVDKILYSYEKNNITTVEQAVEREEDFNKKRDLYFKKKYEVKETEYEKRQRKIEEWLKDE
jgi:DnaD/phage-associated family protein